MRYQKVDKVIFEDCVEKCWCSREKLYRPCTDFRKRIVVDVYQPYCIECVNLTSKGAPCIPNEDDRELSNELLSSLGYNPSSEESIYQQFKKRHNL